MESNIGLKTAMIFENPNKIGVTREEYKEILQELKKRNMKLKIVKVINVTTQWIKGQLRKVVLVAVILANGVFTSQAFACEEYKIQAGDTWSKLSARTGFTVDYLKQINGKETDLLTIGESVTLPDIEEYLADASQDELTNFSVLIENSQLTDENRQHAEEKNSNNQKSLVDKQTYIVQKGDNLWRIARTYQTTAEAIMKQNGFTSTKLKAGQEIIIDGAKQIDEAIEIEDVQLSPPSLSDKSSEEGVIVDNKQTYIDIPFTAPSLSEKSAGESTFVNNEHIYIVQKGDNLWRIARTYQTTVEAIMEQNSLTSTKLKIGQKIIIGGTKQIVKTIEEETGQLPKYSPLNESTGESSFINNEYIYIVKQGDNLWKLARNYKTTVTKIMQDNQLSSTKLVINQKLVIKNENFKTTTAKVMDFGDLTTLYLTKEDGKELILQIPYEKEWELQLLRGNKINVAYIEHDEGVGKLVDYNYNSY